MPGVIPSYIKIHETDSASVVGHAGRFGTVDLPKDQQAIVAKRVHEFLKQDSVQQELKQHFQIGEHRNLTAGVTENGQVYVKTANGHKVTLSKRISPDILSPIKHEAQRRAATFTGPSTGHAPSPPLRSAPYYGGACAPMMPQQPMMAPMQPPMWGMPYHDPSFGSGVHIHQYGGRPMAPPPGYMTPYGHPMMAPYGYPMPQMMCPPYSQPSQLPPPPVDSGASAEVQGLNFPQAPRGGDGHDASVFKELLEQQKAAEQRAKDAEKAASKTASEYYTKELVNQATSLQADIQQLEQNVERWEQEERLYAPGYTNARRMIPGSRTYYDETVVPSLRQNKQALEASKKKLEDIQRLLRFPEDVRLAHVRIEQLEQEKRDLEERFASTRHAPTHLVRSLAPSMMAGTQTITHPFGHTRPPVLSGDHPPLDRTSERHFHFKDERRAPPLSSGVPPYTRRRAMPRTLERGMSDGHLSVRHTPPVRVGAEAPSTAPDFTAVSDQELLKRRIALNGALSSGSYGPTETDKMRRESDALETEATRRSALPKKGSRRERDEAAIEEKLLSGEDVSTWDTKLLNRAVLYLRRKANGAQPAEQSFYAHWFQVAQREQQQRLLKPSKFVPETDADFARRRAKASRHPFEGLLHTTELNEAPPLREVFTETHYEAPQYQNVFAEPPVISVEEGPTLSYATHAYTSPVSEEDLEVRKTPGYTSVAMPVVEPRRLKKKRVFTQALEAVTGSRKPRIVTFSPQSPDVFTV